MNNAINNITEDFMAGNKKLYFIKKTKRQKIVRCIETGEIYMSKKEAALSLGLSENALRVAMYLKCKCGGYNWEEIN